MPDLEWTRQGDVSTCDIHPYCRLLVKYNNKYGDWSWSVWDRGQRIGPWRNKYDSEQAAKGAAISWSTEQGVLDNE